MHELDVAKPRVGHARRNVAHGAWDGLIDILEALQVAALSAQVAQLECPVRA